MLAEPALARLIDGPLHGDRPARSTASVPGVCVLGMAAGLRRPDDRSANWCPRTGRCPSRWPWPSASSPARSTPSARPSSPVIAASQHRGQPPGPPLRHRTRRGTGLRTHRRRNSSPLARHSAKAGALEHDTAELFVRTLSLGRPDRAARHDPARQGQWPCDSTADVPRTSSNADACDRTVPASRSTGRRLDEIVGHGPPQGRPARSPCTTGSRTPAGRICSPEPLLVPETPARTAGCSPGCAASSPRSRSWSTSTAARPASSPWRTSSRSWSARSATSTTASTRPISHPHRHGEDGRAVWDVDGSCARRHAAAASAWRCPRARTRRWPDSSPTGLGPHPRRRRPRRLRRLAAGRRGRHGR
ncbi:hypothetical protein STENM327S_00408 [Streptomyces tendae]